MNKEKISEHSKLIKKLVDEIKTGIAGQDKIILKTVFALLNGGHILLEGVPGLAKTSILNAVANCASLTFRRIQFTPDLLPADLTGTLIFNSKSGEFETKKGPVFSNIILADEINRAPAKVQSALLECMQEKQVTIGNETYKLDEPFLTLATQNPIEQEGTYNLPEAQIDRFMFKLKIEYPKKNEEYEIIQKNMTLQKKSYNKIIDKNTIHEIRQSIFEVFTDRKIDEYIVDIIDATRFPEKYGMFDLKEFISYGASPRGSINLSLCAKTNAYFNSRMHVYPDDVKETAKDVLRHRIILNYKAIAENVSEDDILDRILNKINVP